MAEHDKSSDLLADVRYMSEGLLVRAEDDEFVLLLLEFVVVRIDMTPLLLHRRCALSFRPRADEK